MVTIYPGTVEHTTSDKILNNNCCNGRGYGTQKLYNKDNIKNDKNTYGSWGVDTTNLKLNSLHDSPYCIATPRGTRRQPEKIIGTNWNVSSIPNGASITKIEVEVAYFTDRYINMSTVAGYFPDNTAIELNKSNGKNIKNGTIPGPTSKNTKRSVTFSGLNLKPSDLKNAQITIQPGENKRDGVVCKVKIQYLRIKVTYTDPTPQLKLTDSINKTTIKPNEEYQYKCAINTVNGNKDKTDYYINIPSDTIIISKSHNVKQKSNKNGIATYTCPIAANNIPSTVTLNLKHTSTGTKTITSYLSKYSSSKPQRQITVKAPTITYNFKAKVRQKTENGYINEHYINNDFECFSDGDNSGWEICFETSLQRDMPLNGTEWIIIQSSLPDDIIWIDTSGHTSHSKRNDGWIINNFPIGTTTLYRSSWIELKEPGIYNIKGEHSDTEVPSSNKTINFNIKIKSHPPIKNFFKLQLEDGTDVQYNSLVLTQGDDLKTPLVHTEPTDETDIKENEIIIIGEKKRIPVKEAQYITFKLKLNKEEPAELKNILAYIEAYEYGNEKKISCNDILLGIDNGSFYDINDNKYCLIDKLSTEEYTTLKIAVESDEEKECYIKIRPYNYDNETWKPSYIVFKDYPNVKINIEGPHDAEIGVDDGSNDFILDYIIENKSDIPKVYDENETGLSFQIKEPIGCEPVLIDGRKYEFITGKSTRVPTFNPQNGIIYFPELEAHSRQYVLRRKYRAKRKGKNTFEIKTINNLNTTDDDQYQNRYQHEVLVGVENNIKIKTKVNKQKVYRNDLIDFEITFTSLYRDHKNPLSFIIKDIGDYNELHATNDYEIIYSDYDYGVFEESTSANNSIGVWTIDNIEKNKEYKLTVSLRPQETGLHNIQTIFNDKESSQEFVNSVKVLEKKQKISFNVSHAVNDKEDLIDEEGKCSINIDDLIKICDKDFISLSDDIYYLFSITNNSAEDIINPIYIYGRLPESFLVNGILCSSNIKPQKDNDSNLIYYEINGLEHCSTINFALKLKPNEEGTFISNFTLSTRNADVLNKKLTLTVDSQFDKRELEHEIKIYNFDKTNRYYRYEIDNNSEIFKFFNTGDKSVRQIETESYDIDAVETYKGNNLRKLVQEIKDKSKYVEPELLREGTNKLIDKGYELYPDGFIRRFGLLQSEVFHYSNQLPTITNLAKKAMRWDVDDWNTKVWSGGDYSNGVFDLTIDYSKIPSNFDITEVENPIKNLQALVDNVKPFGTKAICYYSTTLNVSFSINVESVSTEAINTIDINYNPVTDINLTTTLEKADGHQYVINDDIDTSINFDVDVSSIYPYNNNTYPFDEDTVSTGSYEVGDIEMVVYNNTLPKIYVEDCLDILNNLYYTNENTNIDITKDFFLPNSLPNRSIYLTDYHFLNCSNNCLNNQVIGYKIKYLGNEIIMGYTKEKMNDFEGFIIEENGKRLFERNNRTTPNNFTIQVQRTNTDGNNIILHLWGSINQEEYYHIGMINLNNLSIIGENKYSVPEIEFYSSVDIDYEVENKSINTLIGDKSTDPITFKISDKINQTTTKHNYIEAEKWTGLKNINNNGYAEFYYDAKIDKECNENLEANIPKLMVKYNNFDIDEEDEIIDIAFKIKAQSNQNNKMENVNINIYRDGDSLIPDDEIGRKIYYPSSIQNTKQEFLANITIEEPNVTICSDCLKTSLGYYNKCPYCSSTAVFHHNEVTPVTVCDNCGWVIEGTNDYCKRCLSTDVENVTVDYNKTYCKNCNTISDGYHHRCPKCLSKDIVYLDNKTLTCKVMDEDTKNIDTITINTDQVNMNIFNITVPFSQEDSILDDVEYLKLKIKGNNQVNNKYYYCEECGTGGIGHVNVCPKCHNAKVCNDSVDLNNFKTYIQLRTTESIDNQVSSNSSLRKTLVLEEFEEGDSLIVGDFIKTLDLKKYAKQNENESFNIMFDVENQSYSQNIEKILTLPIDEKYKDYILDEINAFNFTIENIFLDYHFIDENDWVGLSNLEKENHTYVKYQNPDGAVNSESLIFSDFNLENNEYEEALLCVSGLCKNNTTNFGIQCDIKDRFGNTYTKTIDKIDTDLFNVEFDLAEMANKKLKELTATITFIDVADAKEILITDCYIYTEKAQYNKNTNTYLDTIPISIDNDKNKYLIKTKNKSMWNLNNQQPYYLSGKHLKTGLLCCFDFGELKSLEYIRIYNIEMILYYKNKTGKIVTESLFINDDNENQIDNFEQLLKGDITKNKADMWGYIDVPSESLSNLESEKLNINEDGELINSIPLHKKILQSFICHTSKVENISHIELEYEGKNGYPNEYINISIYEDKNDNPSKLLYKTIVLMPFYRSVLSVDMNVENIIQGKKYWIVIEDPTSDENNYYKFKFNNNKKSEGKEDETDTNDTLLATFEELIFNNKRDETKTLSFNINSVNHLHKYYELPYTCSVEEESDDSIPIESDDDRMDYYNATTSNFYTDVPANNIDETIDDASLDNYIEIGYKIKNIFHRYNVEKGSNISLKNFKIMNGYKKTV